MTQRKPERRQNGLAFHVIQCIAWRVASRKRISDRTKLAAALGCLLPAKELAALRSRKAFEQAVFKRFDWHHITLHSWGGPNTWWNLHPMLREEHKEQTKKDRRAIAKSNRIRKRWPELRPAINRVGHKLYINSEMRKLARQNPDDAVVQAFQEGVLDGKAQTNEIWAKEASRPGGALRWNRLRSRGFDKRYTKRMDGTVVPRKEKQ